MIAMKDLKTMLFIALKDFLCQISSPARPEEVWPQIETHSLFKRYSRQWERLSSRRRRKAWEQLGALITKVGYATRPYCIRCGACCRQGSPTLYQEDAFLLHSETLSKRDLFTLRVGELAYSNEEGRLVVVKKEAIKIKEINGRCCIFFDEKNRSCTIYKFRPLQCRVMACWDPEGFKTLRKKRPLQRKDIIPVKYPLWEIIARHERRCAVTQMRTLLKRNDKERLQEMAYYDLQTRHFLKENFQINPQEMDFYLGRPISTLIRLYQGGE